VRGEITAKRVTDLPGAFSEFRDALVEGRGWERRLEVERAHPYSKKVIFKFRGVTTASEAEKLCGSTVFRRGGEFVDAGSDSYYISQLKGCRVELPDGTRLGEVEDIISTGGTDVLAVRSPRGEILVPFSRSICIRIEPERKRILVDPPDGLLDLNAV
jgi:16S rRNA processing protein RimM